MFYFIGRQFAKIGLSLYFRKIYFANAQVLPKNKPIILAANHPTAFIEPLIVACWLYRPISFIARGDLYVNSPILRKIYDWSYMTPIFRQEDTGYSNLKSNYETFEKCYQTLQEFRPLMILVEGSTLNEKRVRAMRKGTARIIAGAQEKHGDMDIHLIPVGVNYTNSDDFRSVAMIEFGEPIRCSEYSELFRLNPAKGINKLTREMGKQLKEKVIHIDHKEDDKLVGLLLPLEEHEITSAMLPVAVADSHLFNVQKQMAEKVNSMGAEAKKSLQSAANSYFEKLQRQGVSDAGLMQRKYDSFKNTLFVLLGFIPAMLGYILNIIPIWVGNTIAKKIAPSIEFRAATAIVFSAALYLIYGVVLCLAGYLTGFGWWTFALISIPILGYFYLYYQGIAGKWKAGRRANRLSPDLLAEILAERTALKKKVV